MRKLLAVAVMAAVLATQILSGVAFAATGSDAVSQFQSIINNEQVRGPLLSKLWDYTVKELNDGQPAPSKEEIFNTIKAEFINMGIDWNSIVTQSGANGTIAESTVKTIIQEMLDNRGILISVHNQLKEIIDKPLVKTILVPEKGEQATAGECIVALMEKTRNTNYILTSQVINQKIRFSPYGDVANTIGSALGISGLLGVTLPDAGVSLGAFINNQASALAQMLNDYIDKYGVDPATVISALKIYNLYWDPSQNQGGNTGGDNGGNTGGIPGGNTGGVPSGGTSGTGTTTPEPEKNVNDIINQINKIQPGSASGEQQKIVGLLASAADAIVKVQDNAKAVSLAKDIIKSVSGVISEKEQAAEVVNAALTVAKSVLDKINTQEVVPAETGNTAKAVIEQTVAEKLIKTIDDVIKAAQELNTVLSDGGIEDKVESVLNVKVKVQTKVETVNAEIPSQIFKAALEKKIEKISIDAGVAKIDVNPAAITVSGTEKVSIGVSKVNADTLPEAVKKAVGDSQVYNFTAAVGDTKVSKFKKPLEILLPYVLKDGENADKITVFYVDDNGKLENVVGQYDKNLKAVRFTTVHFSGFMAKENNITFDDIKNNWAKETIEIMASKGIINGKGNGNFEPDTNITRAEFAALVVRAFKLYDAEATCDFTDVNRNDWFYGEVSSAVKAGLVKGRGDGTFAPNEYITRQDMAKLITNALKEVKGKGTIKDSDKYLEKFSDRNNIDDYAKEAVAMAAKYGLVKGMPDGTFVPKDMAKRSEAAKIIYNLFYLK